MPVPTCIHSHNCCHIAATLDHQAVFDRKKLLVCHLSLIQNFERDAFTEAQTKPFSASRISITQAQETGFRAYLVGTDDVDSNKQVCHGNHPFGVPNAEDHVASNTVSEGPVARNCDAEVAPADNDIGNPHTAHHGY